MIICFSIFKYHLKTFFKLDTFPQLSLLFPLDSYRPAKSSSYKVILRSESQRKPILLPVSFFRIYLFAKSSLLLLLE